MGAQPGKTFDHQVAVAHSGLIWGDGQVGRHPPHATIQRLWFGGHYPEAEEDEEALQRGLVRPGCSATWHESWSESSKGQQLLEVSVATGLVLSMASRCRRSFVGYAKQASCK